MTQRGATPLRALLLMASLWGASATHNAPAEAPQSRAGPYTARADTRVEYMPEHAPTWGPAASVIRDPAFGSRIVRVTDASTLGTHPGISFHTDASSEANTWNTTDTAFAVIGSGGHTLVFDFDPATLTPHFSGFDLVLPPLSWTPATDFSHVNAHRIYGWSAAVQPKLQQYDFAGRGKSADVADPAKCFKLEPDSRALDISVSADDSRMLGVLGPEQDRDKWVYVYDQKLGCRWYNTSTGEVGGQWGRSGIVSLSQRFFVHNARLSKGGDYVRITPAGGGFMAFWQVGTLNVTACPSSGPYYCGGHHEMGFSHAINSSGFRDSMNVLIRPLDHLASPSPLIASFPSPPVWALDKHWSWNNDDPSDTAPVCGSTFRSDNPSSPRAALKVERAWDNEVICVQTDGQASTVWRFAHTFSSATNGFWSTPRGNVSQDGKFFMFTSDWENTLGRSADGAGYRTDVFIVELK